MREERTTRTAARTARPRLVGVTSKFKELRSPMITADGSSETAEIGRCSQTERRKWQDRGGD
jgi:hypothetical protein